MGRATKQSATVRFTTVLKVLLLCVLFGGSGLGYVWQQKEYDQLKATLRELQTESFTREAEIRDLRASSENRLLDRDIALEIEKRNLSLTERRPEQVIRIRDPHWRPASAVQARAGTVNFPDDTNDEKYRF